MEEVKLYTSDGKLVTTVVVPNFQTPPDVIIWGSRVFVRKGKKYKEAFAHVAIWEAKHEGIPEENN